MFKKTTSQLKRTGVHTDKKHLPARPLIGQHRLIADQRPYAEGNFVYMDPAEISGTTFISIQYI